MAQLTEGPYSFLQSPQGVSTTTATTSNAARRSRYRDPFQEERERYVANIMWDRRVYRGNTYAPSVNTTRQQEEELQLKKMRAEKRRRRQELRRQREEQGRQEMLMRARTPPPVEGRVHIDIQTETYLEEITDRVIESDQSTQTDPFMERPPSPPFVPAKSGVDKSTQVEDDLFDFDFEVDPILEVIVGKTMEQAMMEVLEEEEMENLKKHQKEFTQRRNAELAETQRMEAEELRRHEEIERRKKQERERLAKEALAREKIASTAFAKSFLRNLERRVFTELEEEGFFYDQVERDVQTEFMPWLVAAVQSNLQKRRDAKHAVNRLIMLAMNSMMDAQRKQE